MNKQNQHITLLTFSTLILFCGCASQHGIVKTKDGSFELVILKSSSVDKKPVIHGYIYSENTREPIGIGYLRLDGEKRYKTDKSGTYNINIEPGKHKFEGQGYGYYWPSTKKIKVSQGDSIRIDFFLKEDVRPLY